MRDVGRHPQPEIRERLLDACTDHALEHGLPDRLAPLADAAGTSSRMLVYHFGTRDQLRREVLQQARRRQLEAWTGLLTVRRDESYLTTLGRAWTSMTQSPYRRMFSRLHDTGGDPLWPNFRRAATTDWLPPLEAGMATLGRPELATVVLAVVRGLFQDLDATGDVDRTDRAFRDFLETLERVGEEA